MFELSLILVWIIFFAVLWFILWLTHRLGIKRKGFSLTKQNLPVVQKREMQLGLPYEQAFAVSTEALDRLPRITLKSENNSKGMLMANSRITWESFGEKIVLNIQRVDDRTTKVEIVSRPIVPITMFDYGKNLENVERIRGYLMPYAS